MMGVNVEWSSRDKLHFEISPINFRELSCSLKQKSAIRFSYSFFATFRSNCRFSFLSMGAF
jgi:hypothetical protein